MEGYGYGRAGRQEIHSVDPGGDGHRIPRGSVGAAGDRAAGRPSRQRVVSDVPDRYSGHVNGCRENGP